MTSENWFKVCLHAHTTESDGDESPERATEWYRRLGYDCLVLSDHNLVTKPEREASDKPILVPGEEVTAILVDNPVAVYVNAVGLSKAVVPIVGNGVLETLQANVDAIVQAGGIASLTAPYYRSSFDHHSLVQVEGATLLDIYNAHPSNILGDPRTFSYEELWDEFLTAGKNIFGTANDDAHNYLEFSTDNSNPGRAWVMARCRALTPNSVVEALRSGDFYASTGIRLDKLESTSESISLTIDPKFAQSYSTTFIGLQGAVLYEQQGTEVRYEIKGDEGYVRARVTSSWGARAWTQPVFVS